MSSRTTMKQQMMREKVMNEEKPHKESVPVNNGMYTNNNFKCMFNNSQSSNDCLSSLTSTIVASEKQFDYCKPFLSDMKDINYNFDRNSSIGEDLPILNFDYNEPISKIDSPYMLQSIYSTDNNYNLQSFNDFNQSSSNIENHIDSNNYNNQYVNLNNKAHQLGPMHDIYGYETSFSCPVTTDQSTSSYNQRILSNSNSGVISAMSLNYDEKRMQLKDRSKKESHNRIERKRRDFINQQIIELSNLLPPQMMTEGESKKNKGNILKNSVVYIQYLQNEAHNTSNFVKEADLAFALVDNYRKQIQELQQQLTLFGSQSASSFSEPQKTIENYAQYLMLHEQNRRTIQSSNQLILPMNNSLLSDMQCKYSFSTYNKSPISTLDNGSPYKIEASSGHSPLNISYRRDEDIRVGSISLSDKISSSQSTQLYPSSNNDYFSKSNNHYRGFVRQRFESMEC